MDARIVRFALHHLLHRSILLLGAIVLAGPGLARADGEDAHGTFSLVFENDVFANVDHHYTNGVRASWLSGENRLPGFVRSAAEFTPWVKAGSDMRVEYGFGQSMFTPSDITAAVPDPSDRPYAGWLYVSAGVVAASNNTLDQLQLSLGVVGPSAHAGEVQDAVHKVINSPRPQGWDYQLADEPGFILSAHRTWQRAKEGSLTGIHADLSPYVGGAIGNILTYADTGATVRFGTNLPQRDYGPPRIEPSLPGSGYYQPTGGFGWYLFAAASGRLVIHNIFLDGNTFSDSPSVDKRPLVGDVQVGISLNWTHVRLAYTHVFRTPEFYGQSYGDQFGAISVSARF